jgi:hypothetical protein
MCNVSNLEKKCPYHNVLIVIVNTHSLFCTCHLWNNGFSYYFITISIIRKMYFYVNITFILCCDEP